MRTFSLTLLSLLLSGPIALAPMAADAQAEPPHKFGAVANPDPAVVQGGHLTLETRHARINFSVNHLGFTNWYGDFTHATGTLDLDPKQVEASQFDITIPVDSLTTTNAQLDTVLKSPQWLDAAGLPTIRFKSGHVVRTGPNRAQVTGDLTLHGVTKPVTLTAVLNGSGPDALTKEYTVGFSLTGTLKRSEFGVSNFVPLLSDEVQLRIEAPFVKK